MFSVKVPPNDKGNPPGKLADAELHFTEGPLEGLKLAGFAVWESKKSTGVLNVTFPARSYSMPFSRLARGASISCWQTPRAGSTVSRI